MASPADVSDAFDFGRRGAMVAVTVVACRRREIAPVQQGLAMHAGVIFCNLRHADGITRHVFGIGVAAAASTRYI